MVNEMFRFMKLFSFIYNYRFYHNLLKKERELIQTLNCCNLYVRDLKTQCGQQWLNDKVLSAVVER